MKSVAATLALAEGLQPLGETRRSSRQRTTVSPTLPADTLPARSHSAASQGRKTTHSILSTSAHRGTEAKVRPKTPTALERQGAKRGAHAPPAQPRRKRDRADEDDGHAETTRSHVPSVLAHPPPGQGHGCCLRDSSLGGALATPSLSLGDSHTTARDDPYPLPALLSHLSLSPTFVPVILTPPTALSPFAFPPPPAPPAPAYRLLHPFHHAQSPLHQTPKRASTGPHPHLLSRTKKRKLFHRFFRSPSLLAGPPPPSSLVTPASSTVAASRAGEPTRPDVTGEGRGKAPSWWPSVSRSGGEGRESRLGPEEYEWAAENEGWVSRLQVRFGSAFGVGTGVVEGDKGKGRDEVGAEEGETSGAGVATRAGGDRLAKVRASKGVGMARSRPRSVSSPPAFHQTQYQQHQPPGAGPPLKQHLLAVLRMRLSEGGGSSRGGEAGLRFKKWVVWNAWMKKTNVVPEEHDHLVLVDSSDVTDDLNSDLLAAADAQESSPHFSHPSPSSSTSLASLPLVLDAASLASAMALDLDPIPSDSPPRPNSPEPALHSSPIDEPLPVAPSASVRLDLSYALGVDTHAEGSSRGTKLAAPPPPLARPSPRRANSLPTLSMPSPARPESPPRVEQERRGRRGDDGAAGAGAGRVTSPIACEA